MTQLTPFEGTPVTSVGIEIPNVSGGLNDGLKIDPVEFHHGDTVVILIETTTAKLRFDPVVKGEPDTGLRRVHIQAAETATIIDRALVADVLDEHKKRVLLNKEKEQGVKRLPGVAPDLDALDDGLDYDGEEPRRIGDDLPDPAADDADGDGS